MGKNLKPYKTTDNSLPRQSGNKHILTQIPKSREQLIREPNNKNQAELRVHSRIAGWKLTSPARRDELLRLVMADVTADQTTAGGGGVAAPESRLCESPRTQARILTREHSAFQDVVRCGLCSVCVCVYMCMCVCVYMCVCCVCVYVCICVFMYVCVVYVCVVYVCVLFMCVCCLCVCGVYVCVYGVCL